VNTVLEGDYRIERVVGSGGFAITYAAEDVHLGTTVALKEYYPIDFGDRDRTMSVRPKSDLHKKTFDWGRANFLREARTLARFEHPSIVRVTRVFEANSTAYMVMRFEEGQSLEAWLAGLGRPPTQEELDRIATPLLEALQIMHAAKFLHRDIAPDNIIVRADGTPVLLDFGAARRAIAEMSRSLTGIVKAGYSPHEQYSSGGRLQGPWSDLYALGGTLYRAVSGRTPDEATLRVDADHMPPAAAVAKSAFRPGFLAAIDWCLKVKSAERPQSVAQLRPMLLGRAPQPTEPERLPSLRKTKTGPVPPQRPSSSMWLAIAAAIALVLGGAYGGYEYAHWQPGAQDAEARQLAALKEVQRNEAAEAAHRQAELEAERQRKEAAEVAQRQVEAEAERQRKEAADAAKRQAELDAERRRKEQMERATAAEEQRRIASREEARPADEAARLKAETAVKSATDRESLTRSLQTALNRVGCYRGKIDGQWGTQGRAALVQFAKLTKLELATDEPTLTVLEAVVARNERVCPLECDDGQVVSDGKCVTRALREKNLNASKEPGNRAGETREREKPRRAESAASKSAATGSGRSCGYGFWEPGQTCRNNAGKTCTITSVGGGKAQKICQ
jgi:hypothetical protein